MDTGRMKPLIWAGVALIGSFAAWQAASAIQKVVTPGGNSAAPIARPKVDPVPVQVAVPRPEVVPTIGVVTPMGQRVATIGLLNKRNGLYRDLVMKPGEARRIGDVVVRLKACETTAPWEAEKLTGSFVQVIVRSSEDSWRKVFSGWLFKESPSLNVVEHPIYDVWTKDCTMRFPETGPATIVVRGGEAISGKGASNAKKSAAPSADDDSAEDKSDL
jgi:hypothetical protein